MSTTLLRNRYTIPGLTTLTMRESMTLINAGLRTVVAVQAATDEVLAEAGLTQAEVASVRQALPRATS